MHHIPFPSCTVSAQTTKGKRRTIAGAPGTRPDLWRNQFPEVTRLKASETKSVTVQHTFPHQLVQISFLEQNWVLLEHFAAKWGELDEMLPKPATSVPGRRAHVALVLECSAKSVHVAPSAVDLWLLALPALESVADVVDWDGCSWSRWFQVLQNFQRFRSQGMNRTDTMGSKSCLRRTQQLGHGIDVQAFGWSLRKIAAQSATKCNKKENIRKQIQSTQWSIYTFIMFTVYFFTRI